MAGLTLPAMAVTLLAWTTLADPSSKKLNPTRPRAFDLAADAETVVGVINKNFSCDGREYGYYADQNQNCQVFHICMPVQTALGRTLDTFQFSFFCPNRTRFSQVSRTCIDEEYAYPCNKAHTLYDLNKHIGKQSSKKQPFNPRASSGGTHRFDSSSGFTPTGEAESSFSHREFSGSGAFESSFASHSSSSGLSSSSNHQSSGTLLENEGTPVHVDSELHIGAPVLPAPHTSFSSQASGSPSSSRRRSGSTGGQSSSFGSGSTRNSGPGSSLAGFGTTSKHTSGPAGANQLTTPDPIIPPGSQLFSTVSINHQNSISHTPKKDAALSSSPRGGFSGVTSLNIPGSFGSPQPFISEASSTTISSINASPVPTSGTRSNRQQIHASGNSGASRVAVNRKPISAGGRATVNSVSNGGPSPNAFPTFTRGSSSTGATQLTQPGTHPSHSAAHSRDFESARSVKEKVESQGTLSPGGHALSVAPISGNEKVPLDDTRKQGSLFQSGGRAHSTSLGSVGFSSNRLSTGSSNSVSPAARQPVVSHRQPVTPSHQLVSNTQRVSPTRQPDSSTHRPVVPVSESVVSTREAVSSLRIPGFSPGVRRTGETHSGTPVVHPASSAGVDVKLTTEYDEEEDGYEPTITTEGSVSEAERNLNEAHFSGSVQGGAGSSFAGGSSFTRSSGESSGFLCFTQPPCIVAEPGIIGIDFGARWSHHTYPRTDHHHHHHRRTGIIIVVRT
ncbi:uncharacterized protein [Panulirus ornatus]|uniref:uncharacterized protein n=1 Tax=Panulirus ornatus TaxID=150431 RepID=UPI003A8C2A31